MNFWHFTMEQKQHLKRRLACDVTRCGFRWRYAASIASFNARNVLQLKKITLISQFFSPLSHLHNCHLTFWIFVMYQRITRNMWLTACQTTRCWCLSHIEALYSGPTTLASSYQSETWNKYLHAYMAVNTSFPILRPSTDRKDWNNAIK
jgi:hypothetical protein